MINVLVTGAGGGVGQGITKSLKMIDDLDIKIVTADMSSKAAGLYSGDVACLVPACTSSGYLDAIKYIFEKESIAFYFPGTDLELEFCARYKNEIKEECGVDVVISSIDSVLIADSKFKTAEFLRKNDLYYPETRWVTDADLDGLEYPLIVKPDIGCRSIGVFRANTSSDITKNLCDSKGMIIQELVGDDLSEYTCTVVKVGNCISTVIILRRDLRAGDTFRAEPVKNETIEKYVHAVAEKLDIYGGCNFQLRLDSNYLPKIFEINCRFSGTTPFCAQLGFNPVEFFLKNKMNLEYEPRVDYESKVLRFWSEVVVKSSEMERLDETKRIEPYVHDQLRLY